MTKIIPFPAGHSRPSQDPQLEEEPPQRLRECDDDPSVEYLTDPEDPDPCARPIVVFGNSQGRKHVEPPDLSDAQIRALRQAGAKNAERHTLKSE